MKNIDLKKFRAQNKLTQEAVAKYLGIRQSNYSKIERGERQLSKENLKKLYSNKEWNFDNCELLDSNERSNSLLRAGSSELRALRKEVEFLREQNKELKAEKQQYWDMIQRLTSTK